jgi:predicted ATPase
VLLAKHRDDYPYFYNDKKFLLLDEYVSYRSTIFFLRKFWSGFRYISPIREAPKRFYIFDDLRKINIGVNGEYTPFVLAVEQETVIPRYYRCIYQGKQISHYELREQDKLLESVNWWLFDFMKLPQIYSVAGFRGVINQVKLHSSGVEVDLLDVGFGITQVLPIIVECLRTQQGETIVLEQPEIHLHPSLQSKLADFFVSMVKSGKNLVIETHSEPLINRLCLRIAQEESTEIKNFTNILFISFNERSKSSVSRPVEINKYGEIENWPVGFFDENDSRDLLAATLKKRMLDS